MRIAVIGRGRVGAALGGRLASAGHEVVYGVRTPRDTDERLPAGAVAGADVILVAVPWSAVFETIDPEGWSGRLVIDSTNPIRRTASGLSPEPGESAAERIQARVPDASVFKAFNTTGFANMENPVVEGRRAMMPFCGDGAGRREDVRQLVADVGFEPVDAGGLGSAALLESLAVLWITMTSTSGLGRDFAFGILRRGTPSEGEGQ